MPCRHGRQRYLTTLVHDCEITKRIQVVPVLLGEPHRDVVLILAVAELRRLGTIDRTSNGEADVPGIETVESSFFPIDFHNKLGAAVRHVAFETVELCKDRRTL